MARQSSSCKKINDKWRVSIDFTNLNEAYLKYNFPFLKVDQHVLAAMGHKLLSSMDAYLGYNQIKMYSSDEDKTAFTTGQRIYCYKVMPFGLKNARATFQRMVDRVFKDLIGCTMEVYIDDMLVKSV